jgi:hypothetical protein
MQPIAVEKMHLSGRIRFGAAGAKVDDILREADLHVLTLSGWHPASTAMFSSSWKLTGRVVENYLFEASELSTDCKRARELLLVPDKPGKEEPFKPGEP